MLGFVRIWHGVTRRSVADEYEEFLIERAVPDYKSMEKCNIYSDSIFSPASHN